MILKTIQIDEFKLTCGDNALHIDNEDPNCFLSFLGTYNYRLSRLIEYLAAMSPKRETNWLYLCFGINHADSASS